MASAKVWKDLQLCFNRTWIHLNTVYHGFSWWWWTNIICTIILWIKKIQPSTRKENKISLFEQYSSPSEYIFPETHCINTDLLVKTHSDGLAVCCLSNERELNKPLSMTFPIDWQRGNCPGTQTMLTPFPCQHSESHESGSSHECSSQYLPVLQDIFSSQCWSKRYLHGQLQLSTAAPFSTFYQELNMRGKKKTNMTGASILCWEQLTQH